jgi:hypothetical protein
VPSRIFDPEAGVIDLAFGMAGTVAEQRGAAPRPIAAKPGLAATRWGGAHSGPRAPEARTPAAPHGKELHVELTASDYEQAANAPVENIRRGFPGELEDFRAKWNQGRRTEARAQIRALEEQVRRLRATASTLAEQATPRLQGVRSVKGRKRSQK